MHLNILQRELNKKIYNGFKQIVVILTPQRMSEPKKVAGEIIKSKNRKKVVACFLGNRSVKDAVEILKKARVPVYTHCC